MLVHHANAQGNGFMRIPDLCRLAFYFYLTRIGSIEAIEDGHQRGLACAVFANDAVNGALRNAQVHICIRLDCAKALANARKPHGCAAFC